MLEEVTAMFVTTFNSEPWNEKWTKETASNRLKQWLQWDCSYGLVCYQQGCICGIILGHEEQNFDGITFSIREFCVANGMQGKGIGRSLYSVLETQLQQQNINSVNLLTLNKHQTISFYQKLGYTQSKNSIYMDKSI